MAKKQYFLPVLSAFFSIYLPKTKGLSANTARAYRQTFRLLLEYVYGQQGLTPEKIEFRHLEKGVILSWLDWISETRGCSSATRNHRLAAIITFSRFAIRENFEDALALCAEIERIPKKRSAARPEAVHMTREEMSILLRLPDTNYKTGQRDRVILSTLYATGARAQELCDITIGDIRFGETTTVTLHGKGDKTRVVVIPSQCGDLLKTHIARNLLDRLDIDKRHHVFSSQTHEHMTISGLEAIVKKYVKQAKEMRPDLFRHNFTPHSFRHSIAMHMLESGIPLPVIKTFLGHVSIATTMVYASANFELVGKYLRDKDPYADQGGEISEEKFGMVIPQFLR